MPPQTDGPDWDFSSAIELLRSLSLSNTDVTPTSSSSPPRALERDQTLILNNTSSHLGDFSSVWSLFRGSLNEVTNDVPLPELEADNAGRGVRWRDELDGADLEDNVEPALFDTAASTRTQKRAARRVRARVRAENVANASVLEKATMSDTATDAESGGELERLRRSPDRRAVIQDILGRHRPNMREASSPPTSPSPPKGDLRPIKKDRPISDPFLWPVDEFRSTSSRSQIVPRDGLSITARKRQLIAMLSTSFPSDSKYLANLGLVEPAFTPLNISTIGVHVFIDISNVSMTCC